VLKAVFVILAISLCLYAVPGTAPAPRKTLQISEQNAQLLEKIGSYPDLEVLSITCVETLRSLPDSLGKLTGLKELIIDNGNGCSMNPLLPETIGNLHSLEKLVLYGAQDPRGVGNEPGVQPSQRHKFPRSMSQLDKLVYLDLGRNGFNDIPAFVKDLPRLKELGFEQNNLKTLPAFLTSLQQLTTLKLAGNDLDDLPEFLHALPNLTRIAMGNNCRLTKNFTKMKELKARFPKVAFDFINEYDCRN
jgi:Leucine-rich repeat (LRR) protein